ncbi:substrate-binding domain-containing protein [Streptomyces sp. NPDC001165]|uniref:phosphorylase family protein n=1 Tax=Streptomyces sp. NPDC001165 TaxID=3364546 RepID=UPI0036849AD1
MADTSSGPVAVILTALQVEYDAVSARLEGLTRSSEKGTVFERGRLPGTPWTVVLAQTGPGNDNAALVTQHAYDLYRPRVLLFVGIAGGLKDDIRIGDVVIGERIYDYREKQSPRGDHYRPRGWEAPWRLVQHVQRMTFGPDVAGRVRVAPIASGNVVLDRETSELGEVLRGNYDDAVAIEMESAGVCRAAHLIGGLDTLTIRGISDKADGGKGRADAGGSQEIAAWCAAAVAVRILASLAPEQETPTLPDAGSVGGAPGAGSASQELLGASAAGTDESGPPEEGKPPTVPPPHHRWTLLSRARLGRRAQPAGRTRTTLMACGAVALVGVLVAVLLKATADAGPPDGDSALKSCKVSQARVKLHVAASIDLSKSLSDAARDYGARQSPDGTCVKVEVSSVNSGTAMRALRGGWPEDDGPRPDVWSPAGSEWVDLARTTSGGRRLLPESEPRSIVTSPLTIAMPKPMAETMGWPETTIGWSDLAKWAEDPTHFWAEHGNKQWGALKLGKTNPDYSTSGLNATIGAFYAKTGTTGELSIRDVDSSANQAFVRNIEKSVVHYGDTTLTFLANLRAADDKGGREEVLKYISAVTVEESAVVAYNKGYPCGAYSYTRGCEQRGKPKTPLVSFYPKDSDPASDHPYVQLGGMSKAKQKVSDDFLTYLHSTDAYRKHFAPYGYRTYERKVLAHTGIDQDHGALRTPQTKGYDAPDGEVLDRLQQVWASLRRRANVLVVIDTSKSMDDKVPGTGDSKMQLLRRAEPARFGPGGFADTDRVGLWKFSNAASLDGKHHYVPLVDIGPMGEKLTDHHGLTRRDELKDEVNGLVPNGATGLYSTVDAAVDSMRKDYDPAAINAIVLLTDGRNEGVPPTPTLKDVLARIGTPDERVRVFTVAYGSKADQQDANGRTVLEEIAAATGAHAYDAKDPKVLSEVLTSVISNF